MNRCVIIIPVLRLAYVSVFVEVLEMVDGAHTTALQELLGFCEVISRTALIHELQITPFSLGTAVARGLSAPQVAHILKKYARSFHIVDWERVFTFIRRCMSSYTRARLVIRGDGGKVEVECADDDAFAALSSDPVIRSMMLLNTPSQQQNNNGDDDDDDDDGHESENNNQQQQQPQKTKSFQLQDIQCATHVVERSFALGMPLRREYDFENDTGLRRTSMALRASAQPRPYQRAAVESAFGSGRCSSGVIVIPCGGGKTLVGVMCIAAVRRPAVVLCVNGISVDQWKEQIERYACIVATTVPTQQQQHSGNNDNTNTMMVLGGGGGGGNVHQHSGARGQQQGQTTHNKNNNSSSNKQYRQQQTAAATGSTPRIALWTAKRKDPITDQTDVVITTYHALAGLVRRRALQLVANNNPADAAASSPRGGVPAATMRGFNNGRNSTGGGSNSATSAINHPLLTRSWGLLLLDEAHVVPATYFRDGVSAISAKAAIGLTATFVREDDRIGDLQHLCGPKLFDIGWETLRDAGYLASVQCKEVIIPLPPLFQTEYWSRYNKNIAVGGEEGEDGGGGCGEKKAATGKQQQKNNKSAVAAAAAATNGGSGNNNNVHPVLIALAASNPNKILCAKAIVERHRGQKILIFCDIISLLLEYASQLKCPAVHGGVPHAERVRLFSDFENTSSRNVLCVSRVGEISINLPSARVVIQVSSHGASRRQEAQRLGRVLRPKGGAGALDLSAAAAASAATSSSSSCCSLSASTADSCFYSLVSADTIEVDYAARRTRFLIDQGYQADQEHWAPAPLVVGESQAAPTTTTKAEQGDVKPENGADYATDSKARNKNSAPTVDCRDPEWIVGWLVKVIARWELDQQQTLVVPAGETAGRRRGRGGAKSTHDDDAANQQQQQRPREQRGPLANWTVGAEKDRIVYDEA